MSPKQIARVLLGGVLLLLTSQGLWAQDEANLDTLAPAQRTQLSQAEVEKARELLKQGYFDSAVVSYQKAFSIDPDNTVPYQELGELMLEKRNFAYAIKMYAKLGELEPNNPEWQTVLFDLYDAYDMQTEALKSGQRLIELGEGTPKMMQRMAELYKATDRTAQQIEIMEVYAQSNEVDAEYWNEIGELYLQTNRNDDAARAFQTALEMEPGNVKYRTGLGTAYLNANRLDAAQVLFEELAAADPDNTSHGNQLAKIYAAQGDDYLANGRANTALEYYRKAEKLSSDPDLQNSDDDLNVVNPVRPNGQLSAERTQVGPGTVRPALVSSAIGKSLSERIQLAKTLMHPQYLFGGDFGTQDINNYKILDNTLRVPVRGTELDLRVRYNYRDVSDGVVGSASRDFLYAGASYNFDKNWSATGYVGSYGLYSLQGLYDSDSFRAGAIVERDIWSYTPLALGTQYKYNRQGLFTGVSVGPRLSVGGAVDFYQFDDGSDQTIYSVGPTYQILSKPGKREWQVSYEHSGQFNNQQVNDFLRFAPANLQTDSVGTEYTEIVTDWWRLRGGYYHSWINDGTDGDSYLIGSDFQLWQGAWLGLEYVRGNFANGVIPGTLQSTSDSNDNLNVNFGVHF